MTDYSGKTVWITGASSGIGEALARQYAQEGANLILSARRLERLESLARELTGPYQKSIALAADVTRDGELDSVIERAIDEFGRLDVVVANAGFAVGGRLDQLGLEDYRRQFEVNVFGVLRTVYASLPELKKNRGRIVLIGSALSAISMPESSAYCMSKFALAGLSDALGAELAASGVSVTLVMPGFIDTAIFDVNNRNELSEGRNGKFRPSRLLLMSSERAARKILHAADVRKRRQVITFHAQLGVWLSRYFPGTLNWALRKLA